MSCENVPPYFTSPVLQSKIIQDLQQLLQQNCLWLQLVYPIARVGERKIGDSTYRYPQVYKNGGDRDYFDIQPTDQLLSYAWFELESPLIQDINTDEMNQRLSVIVFVNLRNLDPGRPYDYTSELVADIIRIIQGDTAFSDMVDTVDIETDPKKVFSRYLLSEADDKFLMYPFGAFRITLTVNDYSELNCQEEFIPIGGDPCNNTSQIPFTPDPAPTPLTFCERVADCPAIVDLDDRVTALENSGGGSGSVESVFTAGETIAGQRAMMLIGGLAYQFDPANLNAQCRYIGISKMTANIGEAVTGIIDGLFTHSGFGLTTGEIYFAGSNGQLTTIPPSPIEQMVGVAQSTDSIYLYDADSVQTQ